MMDVLNLALPYFGLIFIGFACGKLKQIPDTALGWMNFFIVYVALPALFYRILSRTPLSQLAQVEFILATTLGTALAFAIAFLIGLWIRMLTIPYHLLFPAIIAFCCIGAFSVNNSVFDVFMMALFGIVGYALIKLDFEPAPLLLGFVLGPMLEENLRRAMLLSRGSPSVFVTHPLSLALLVISLALLIIVVMPNIRAKREEAFSE